MINTIFIQNMLIRIINWLARGWRWGWRNTSIIYSLLYSLRPIHLTATTNAIFVYCSTCNTTVTSTLTTKIFVVVVFLWWSLSANFSLFLLLFVRFITLSSSCCCRCCCCSSSTFASPFHQYIYVPANTVAGVALLFFLWWWTRWRWWNYPLLLLLPLPLFFFFLFQLPSLHQLQQLQ